MSFKHHKQMSESFLTAAFLSVSGGLQDAYTYIFRGKVFANAQTGNIVLLSQSIIDKDFGRAIHYLVPLLFFALASLSLNVSTSNFSVSNISIGANWFSYLRFFFCWLLDFCRQD